MKTIPEVLLEKIDELLESRKDALCAGAAKDYADYAGLVGMIHGLNMTKRELLTLNEIDEDAD